MTKNNELSDWPNMSDGWPSGADWPNMSDGWPDGSDWQDGSDWPNAVDGWPDMNDVGRNIGLQIPPMG